MIKMYHIFSEGDQVLFRDEGDYIFFNNLIASQSYQFRITPLVHSVMSTHFHIVAIVPDYAAVEDYSFNLRKRYPIHYYNRYGHSIGGMIRISSKPILSAEQEKGAVLYVLRNPMHHYVKQCPLSYRFSSASCMFESELYPQDRLEAISSNLVQVCNLSNRKKRAIFGRSYIPGSWLVDRDNMIVPSSFINIGRAEACFGNNVRSFLYEINSKILDAEKAPIDPILLESRSRHLDDIQVCNIIDKYAESLSLRSFHYFNAEQLSVIIGMLKQRRVPQTQIARCLHIK